MSFPTVYPMYVLEVQSLMICLCRTPGTSFLPMSVCPPYGLYVHTLTVFHTFFHPICPPYRPISLDLSLHDISFTPHMSWIYSHGSAPLGGGVRDVHGGAALQLIFLESSDKSTYNKADTSIIMCSCSGLVDLPLPP